MATMTFKPTTIDALQEPRLAFSGTQLTKYVYREGLTVREMRGRYCFHRNQAMHHSNKAAFYFSKLPPIGKLDLEDGNEIN